MYPHPFWFFQKRRRLTFYERLSFRPMPFILRAKTKDGWLHYYAASAFAVVAVMFLPVFYEFLTNSTGNSNPTITLSKPISPPYFQLLWKTLYHSVSMLPIDKLYHYNGFL